MRAEGEQAYALVSSKRQAIRRGQRRYKEECKLYREIRFTQVADRLTQNCKYFKFTDAAISELVQDVITLHRAIKDWDRHLHQDDDDAYTCNCSSDGESDEQLRV